MHQQKQIRLLTESEVKEFLDGNPDAVESYDYLDTCDLIQCLPYNNSYEIPKEMIHIGAWKGLRHVKNISVKFHLSL